MVSRDNDEWLEWAAYNLAIGIADTYVKGEMIKNGFSAHDIDVLVQKLTASPEYRAALQLSRKFKLTCALNEALLELESQVFDFSKIKRISELSSQNFQTHYYSANRPVIIEDVVSGWRTSRISKGPVP